MEPIRCDKGYVIYKFISNLFSRYRTPQPEKAPTNLIAIPEYHAHEEAAHLASQEPTLCQQVLEEAYALPLLILGRTSGPLRFQRPCGT
jgi:hypothetical protein